MIIITGATGNIGSKLTQDLLARGRKVRCIARSADKLNQFTEQGAEAAAISLEQTDALTEAFSGAEVLFAMIPPNGLSTPIFVPNLAFFRRGYGVVKISGSTFNALRYSKCTGHSG